MVDQVRRFNRAVVQRVGALDDSFLGTHRPYGEARLLWEIGPDGCEVRALRRRLDLDSGYASRMLRALEADGLVRVTASPADRRVRTATLTKRGRAQHAALAIPLTTDAGEPFPDRALIVFLAFTVIFTTLVLQGLTLPLVIRALRLEDESAVEAEQEANARIQAAEAALARLEELADEDWVRDSTAERLRGTYGFRQQRFASRLDPEADGSFEERSLAFQRLRAELLAAERATLHRLRNEGEISSEVWQRLLRDVDLENSRLDAPHIER